MAADFADHVMPVRPRRHSESHVTSPTLWREKWRVFMWAVKGWGIVWSDALHVKEGQIYKKEKLGLLGSGQSLKPIFHWKLGLRWLQNANEIYTKNMKCTWPTGVQRK